MALQTSGAISLANVQTEFGGVNPISISEYYGKAAGIPASGTISLSHFYGKSNRVLTLKEVVFNASGTFTMPAGVVNNQIIVGCTGGGGGGYADGEFYVGGGGSGRTVTTLTMSAGATATVTVGAGGAGFAYFNTAYDGGTSSFTGATSCLGGKKDRGYTGGAGVSGGGAGGSSGHAGSSSSCPASLTLQSGAINSTTSLFTAKSYSGGSTNGIVGGGGGGCYGTGGQGGVSDAASNTGGGGGSGTNGGSGKVVVWYYTYE